LIVLIPVASSEITLSGLFWNCAPTMTKGASFSDTALAVSISEVSAMSALPVSSEACGMTSGPPGM